MIQACTATALQIEYTGFQRKCQFRATTARDRCNPTLCRLQKPCLAQ